MKIKNCVLSIAVLTLPLFHFFGEINGRDNSFELSESKEFGIQIKKANSETMPALSFGNGEGNNVSKVRSQVSKIENGKGNIRFVAAVKGELDEANNLTLPGTYGFHLEYEKNSQIINRMYNVEYLYNSISATVDSNKTYYSNDYSIYKENYVEGESDYSLKTISDWNGENCDYNFFIALELRNIPEADLNNLITVQAYCLDNNSSSYDVSSEVKYTSFNYTQSGTKLNKVSGTVKSDQYVYNSVSYDLYDIDYSKLNLVFTNVESSEVYNATIDESGTYNALLAEGQYQAKYEYENFVCKARNLEVLADGTVVGDKDFIVDTPLVKTSVVVNGKTLSGGNAGNIDLTQLEDHKVVFGTAGDADCYLNGTYANDVVFEATLKNLKSNGTGTATRYQIGLIFTGFVNGTAKTRDAVIMDLTNAVAPYTKDLMRPWLSNAWKNANGLVGDIQALENAKTDTGVKMTVVKKGSNAYVFVDGQYVTTITGINTAAGALGFQNLSKTGGTIEDFKYSYNEDLINAFVAAI